MRTSLFGGCSPVAKCLIMRITFAVIIASLMGITSVAFGQPTSFRYRTFSQTDFSMKKDKAGKAYQSVVTFKFYNITGSLANGIHAKLNSNILSITDLGGFTNYQIIGKGKEITFSGKDIPSGDSVSITLVSAKKAPGTMVSKWEWTFDGSQVGLKNSKLPAIVDIQNLIQPNGGNVRDFIYKQVVTRPQGVVVGLPTDTPGVGWIRYMKSDRGYFPQSGTARCFDGIMTGSGATKAVRGELKNPKVKKHDNELLAELHLLKLAIIANDAGTTEPLDSLASLFGDLVYNDSSNATDPCNGLTLRGVVHLADSAFTYCSHFGSEMYNLLLTDIARINRAFDGAYSALSFNPFVLAGTHDLSEVYFLHAQPGLVATKQARNIFGLENKLPAMVTLSQNYPNPFNPITTIEFTLPEDAYVTVKVYNTLGQEVATIADHEAMFEGSNSVDFDAGNLPSGLYFYRLIVNDNVYTTVNKMMLLK